MSESALIIDAVRTPRGRGSDKGALRGVQPVELLAQALRAIVQRTGVDPARIADAVIGCVTQTGEQGSHVGRLGALAAGWPDTVPALTVNRYCASGLSAVGYAALQALASDGFAVGGGVESMSRVPMASDAGPLTHDAELARALRLVPIGLAADAVATMEGFSRADCDAIALASQQRAVHARDAGWFRSVVPVEVDGRTLLATDETPRASTTAATLADLQPAFAGLGAKTGLDEWLAQQLGLARVEHVHTAGNAPAMADGASAVLLASPGAVRRLGLKPRARLVALAEVAVDRTLALTGAVDATRAVLARAGLGVADVDLFEVNESFAALMLHFMRHLGVPHERLNVNGGAIALGHAMGSTGSALLGTALDELERRGAKRAVAAACGATGLAAAALIERMD
ncbi:acetyl-CoA C-acyltransferase [Calidifontimicrobium sp. SYSU G02091]|uniref:acetyl-CoA C-acyltransferase n=1 Tax=Calidifontimicrobium sp. SYSU G02091 TaxID=2926421 RepID=UPI001F53C831|nr:acetyl-CoA C-acyltransferase [Calidifontimicrobium sp. SYSU G02091]MCI1191212.1 acetyl-CoA C-acyltransferase [Calidifontimicrobium sp. SYSU G02091]